MTGSSGGHLSNHSNNTLGSTAITTTFRHLSSRLQAGSGPRVPKSGCDSGVIRYGGSQVNSQFGCIASPLVVSCTLKNALHADGTSKSTSRATDDKQKSPNLAIVLIPCNRKARLACICKLRHQLPQNSLPGSRQNQQLQCYNPIQFLNLTPP